MQCSGSNFIIGINPVERCVSQVWTSQSSELYIYDVSPSPANKWPRARVNNIHRKKNLCRLVLGRLIVFYWKLPVGKMWRIKSSDAKSDINHRNVKTPARTGGKGSDIGVASDTDQREDWGLHWFLWEHETSVLIHQQSVIIQDNEPLSGTIPSLTDNYQSTCLWNPYFICIVLLRWRVSVWASPTRNDLWQPPGSVLTISRVIRVVYTDSPSSSHSPSSSLHSCL